MYDIGPLLEPELPKLRRYARQLARDAGRADDLVQSCLVRALGKQHLWREGTDLRAWLFTILHNEFVTEARRRTRERERLPNADIRPATMPGADPELAYRIVELRMALPKLPRWQREVLVHAGFCGTPYAEVANALALPVGTVRSRLARAREQLRAFTDEAANRKRGIAHSRAAGSHHRGASCPPRRF
jgi:RNA polymerase sigma-70 factor, ECF subfamily